VASGRVADQKEARTDQQESTAHLYWSELDPARFALKLVRCVKYLAPIARDTTSPFGESTASHGFPHRQHRTFVVNCCKIAITLIEGDFERYGLVSVMAWFQ
jgi:hypothetical protein